MRNAIKNSVICPWADESYVLLLIASGKTFQAFVEYSSTDGSSKAKISLHQRKFGGNTVIATYYPEDKFARGELDG